MYYENNLWISIMQLYNRVEVVEEVVGFFCFEGMNFKRSLKIRERM